MKITLFLLLATAVVGRAQTTTELLPVGTEAPDFQITNDKTGEKIFRLSDWKTKTDADGKVAFPCGKCSADQLRCSRSKACAYPNRP